MDIDTPRPETNKDEEEIIEEENPEANASNDEELDALFPNETIDPAAIMLEQQDLAEPNPTPKELAPAPKEPSKPKTAPVVSAVPAAPKSPKKPALKVGLKHFYFLKFSKINFYILKDLLF